ncbi:MAG: helix-turn-helix domain-containing protein [Paracoccaceae bacterium]|nr:helix-turn-helix domain-containing protein [Paracoccaceae bacterium]
MNRNIKIVIVPGFSYLSLGSILEPLQTLKNLYRDLVLDIELISITDDAIRSKSGISIRCDTSFQDCLKDLTKTSKTTAVFLCCGLKTPFDMQSSLKKILRLCDLKNIPIFGVGAAGWKMADAGILAKGTGTVHWTTLAAFKERNHDIEVKDALFIKSGQATSSPGEAATLDMMIDYIKSEFSLEYAERVCDHLMITYTRNGDLEQPKSTAQRLRDVPKSLQKVIALMEDNLEEPLTLKKISHQAGLSLRQIERLFSSHLSKSPKKYYLKRRLMHARQLIEQTSLSILEVSIVSGFSSRQIFSKYYKLEYGFTPSETRQSP